MNSFLSHKYTKQEISYDGGIKKCDMFKKCSAIVPTVFRCFSKIAIGEFSFVMSVSQSFSPHGTMLHTG